MTESPNPAPAAAPLLRVWPGVVLVVVQWLLWFVVPRIFPTAAPGGVLGGAACGLGVIVWWLFFSRAPGLERVGVMIAMIAAVVASSRIIHPSIAGGMMGLMLYVLSIPVMCLALVAAVVIGRQRAVATRRVVMAGTILIGCASFGLVRTDGITGEGGMQLRWRWTKTSEELLLAQGKSAAATRVSAVPVAANATGAEWPGYRGPERDGVVHGSRIETDWAKTPPAMLWRHAVGPGWSSFAVRGDFFYTQEQLGEDEVIACYRVSTGEPVWQHRDAVRFWESNAGAGPRATPTLHGNRVYAFGATGVLNALDIADGKTIWSRNVAVERHTSVPMWGFASSPLVCDDVVIVAVPGKLAAYELASGKPRWFGAPLGTGYSSPQRATIGGVAQVLLLSSGGAMSLAPATGKALWTHEWKGDGIVQPALTADGSILIGSGSGLGGSVGTRCLGVTPAASGWAVEERWTSRALKPYYNDLVVHRGHAFGIDGNGLACIDLKDGERKWKGGRYGSGQLVLLADQDLLLVLSEKGELALVGADAGGFKEVARVPAITGKTWNHPVLVGDMLLVRNSEEMAAFRLARKNG